MCQVIYYDLVNWLTFNQLTCYLLPYVCSVVRFFNSDLFSFWICLFRFKICENFMCIFSYSETLSLIQWFLTLFYDYFERCNFNVKNFFSFSSVSILYSVSNPSFKNNTYYLFFTCRPCIIRKDIIYSFLGYYYSLRYNQLVTYSFLITSYL